MMLAMLASIAVISGLVAWSLDVPLDPSQRSSLEQIQQASAALRRDAKQEQARTARAQDSIESQRIYNTLFPYYAEVCALTRHRQKDGRPGGSGGHATMFINGACRDETSPYPRLKLCSDGVDLTDPDSGVGISVNKIFRNANWVAIPGRAQFFRGALEESQVLDDASYTATIRRALEAGWFGGIELQPEFLAQKPPDISVPEFLIRRSIGTDFAVNFARTAYCARLPLEREGLSAAVDHLNGANDQAFANGYAWDGITNNCSHVIHNALAAAGIFLPKETRGEGLGDKLLSGLSVGKILLGRQVDISYPSNTFVRTYEAGNRRPIDDVLRAFRNRDLRRTLGRDDWISTGPGALTAVYPMHPAENNEKFELGGDPRVFSIPLVWNKKDLFTKLAEDPPQEATDLGVNLEHYRSRYARALERRGQARDYLRGPAYFPLEDRRSRAEFERFYGRFYEHLERQALDLEEKLRQYQRLTERP